MGNTNTVSNEFLNSMTQKRKRFVPRFQLVFTYRITSFRLFVLVPSGMRLIGVLIDRFSNWIFAKITYFFTQNHSLAYSYQNTLYNSLATSLSFHGKAHLVLCKYFSTYWLICLKLSSFNDANELQIYLNLRYVGGK